MSGYDNTNTGILGRNERKTEDRHPDFTGKLNVEGREFFLDAWVKERKDGSGRFFSVRVKPKDGQRQGGGPAPRQTPGADLNDDIPFRAEFR